MPDDDRLDQPCDHQQLPVPHGIDTERDPMPDDVDDGGNDWRLQLPVWAEPGRNHLPADLYHHGFCDAQLFVPGWANAEWHHLHANHGIRRCAGVFLPVRADAFRHHLPSIHDQFSDAQLFLPFGGNALWHSVRYSDNDLRHAQLLLPERWHPVRDPVFHDHIHGTAVGFHLPQSCRCFQSLGLRDLLATGWSGQHQAGHRVADFGLPHHQPVRHFLHRTDRVWVLCLRKHSCVFDSAAVHDQHLHQQRHLHPGHWASERPKFRNLRHLRCFHLRWPDDELRLRHWRARQCHAGLCSRDAQRFRVCTNQRGQRHHRQLFLPQRGLRIGGGVRQ